MLSDVAEDTVAQFTADYRVNRDVSVETLIDKGVEIEGERAQLKQAFWNLLSNAADATPDGGVHTRGVGIRSGSRHGCVQGAGFRCRHPS